MSLVFSIIIFLTMIALLVTVHELGHFCMARSFGVKILRFSIGFGKPLFSWRDRQGTEYTIARFPLGGYVQMLDESSVGVAKVEKSQMLNHQSVGRRILIAFAGPAANWGFSVLIFWFIYMIGITTPAPVIHGITPGSIAEKAGLQAGNEIIAINQKSTLSWQDVALALLAYQGKDQLLSVKLKDLQSQQEIYRTLNVKEWAIEDRPQGFFASLGINPYISVLPTIGSVLSDSPGLAAGFQEGDEVISISGQEINDWATFVNVIQAHPGETLTIKIARDGEPITLIAKPKLMYQDDGKPYGYLGLLALEAPLLPSGLLRTRQYNPVQAFRHAVHETFILTKMTLNVVGKIINGKLSIDTISGPIGIAHGAGQSATLGVIYFFSFLAFISISLAVLNILPIPMLDGGHILYYLIEALRGKPLSANAREFGLKVGLSLLVLVMGIAFYNDLSKIFN